MSRHGVVTRLVTRRHFGGLRLLLAHEAGSVHGVEPLSLRARLRRKRRPLLRDALALLPKRKGDIAAAAATAAATALAVTRTSRNAW